MRNKVEKPKRPPDFIYESKYCLTYSFWFEEMISCENDTRQERYYPIQITKLGYSYDYSNVGTFMESFCKREEIHKAYKEWQFNNEMKKILGEK